MNFPKPVLSGATFEFVQDGNTLGSTDEIEHIEVRLEYQLLGESEEPFVVLKSQSGWSVDDVSELHALVNRCLAVTHASETTDSEDETHQE